MAAVSNTYQTYQTKGIREELSDVISRVAMEETPFISNIGKESVNNTFYEWQVDDLAAVDTNNAQIEGDDITAFDAVVPTVRVGNYTQIMRKTLILSDTNEKVRAAGRKSELAYGLVKKGLELRRDMEAIFLANQAASAGTSTTARKTGALPAFITTNTVFNSGGTPAGANPPTLTGGAPTTARTDSGTQQNFTEAMLKNALQQVYKNGGKTDLLMVGPINKQRVSTFAGIAQLRTETNKKAATIVGAADVYLGDFGPVSVVPNIFQRERDAFLLDTDYVSVATLRALKQVELAKTGDAEKRMLVAEAGLKVLNQKAHAIIADLSSTPIT